MDRSSNSERCSDDYGFLRWQVEYLLGFKFDAGCSLRSVPHPYGHLEMGGGDGTLFLSGFSTSLRVAHVCPDCPFDFFTGIFRANFLVLVWLAVLSGRITAVAANGNRS